MLHKTSIFFTCPIESFKQVEFGFFKHVVMEVKQCLKFQGNEYWFHEVFGFVVENIGKLGVKIVMNWVGVGHS
jgi:hypothetical protein